MKTLAVLLNSEPVAVLHQDSYGARGLTYSTHSSPDLSLALPWRSTPYTQKSVDPFIMGLLPESDDARLEIARRFGVSPENPFALLEHIGLDCAGAVQFVAIDALQSAINREGSLHPLTDADIGKRIRALEQGREKSWMLGQERWSLAGAQSKFALRLETGVWHEAHGAEATSHIVKPGIYDLHHQALNEHICLRTLARAGMYTAETSYREFDGASAIVARRYDRFVDPNSGQLLRIHQEDFCQATSTLPRRKYESDRGPRAADILKLLKRETQEEEWWVFVDGLIGNYLLGAPDAHAKNYSLIINGGTVVMAPLYDVASGLPYSAADSSAPSGALHAKTELRKAAMAIGGERRFGHVTRKHWLRFATENGLSTDRLLERVNELSHLIPQAMAEVMDEERELLGNIALFPRLLDPVQRLCAITRQAL